MIDCDVHNGWKSPEVLLPYLEPYYRNFLERGELAGSALLGATRPWLHPEGWQRMDAGPAAGGPPGSDYPLMREQLLDRYGIEYAVLTNEVMELSTVANFRLAAALASAVNEWVLETWLPLDPRFLASVLVAAQDPVSAAAEIRRVGGHSRFVQVLLASGAQLPYGHPFYESIWDAAAEVGLPVAIHQGGNWAINAVSSAAGMPTYFMEYHSLQSQAAIAHLTSLICQGVFERYPRLRVVLVEMGVAWLPGVLWRLDGEYKGLRAETPWLKRLPSEYVWEHVRLTTQPLENPKDKRQLWAVLEAMQGENILMFGSDYPHYDFDDPEMIPIPREWAESIFDANARSLYGLPPRERPPAEHASADRARLVGA